MGGYHGGLMFNYNFAERLDFSNGFSVGLSDILVRKIPGAIKVVRASEADDRKGIDYRVLRADGKQFLVDAKIRNEDWSAKNLKYDDLALETWSVIQNGIGIKVGWTRDTAKHTDYILWLWTDTGRFFLVPFPMLCGVFENHWREWATTYKTARQDSGEWQSECVFVPRLKLMEKLSAWHHN